MKDFKEHPRFKELKISQNGKEFYYNDRKLKVKKLESREGHFINVVLVKRIYYSAAKLILEAWNPKPKDNKRYYAKFRDGNKDNLKLSNLYWSTRHLSKEDQFKRDCKLSALGKDQMYASLYSNKFKNKSKSAIAKELGVSEMAVARAINRLEKKIDYSVKKSDD